MSHAFYGCKYLHIIIPPSVSYIAPDAFDQCNEYSYENLCIEVPKGKKEKLEQLNEHLAQPQRQKLFSINFRPVFPVRTLQCIESQ